MFAPIARLNDMHLCPMQTPAVVPIPHVGGPLIGPGAPTVLAGGVPISVLGDTAVCFGPPDVMVLAAFSVLAEGKPVVRICDTSAHGGVTLIGLPTVLVGDSGGSGSPQAATMSAARASGLAFVQTSCNAEAALSLAQAAPPAREESGKSWVELQIVDEQGRPIAFQKLTVTDSSGAVLTAYSDSTGIARLGGIAAGECSVTIPGLDGDSWERA